MLGTLLITWKNGRTVKTYGPNRLAIYNMKFTFICIVIVISCSVCASGDLEIYPDSKFDLSSEEQRPRLETGEDASFYNNYRQWPWEQPQFASWRNRKKEQELELELPEQFQKFEELLDRNQNQFKNDEDLPVYYNQRNFEDAYDEYKNLERNRNLVRLNFRYPSGQILDDVRPYPHEDDFSFGDENVEDGVEPRVEHGAQHSRHAHQAEPTHKDHEHHMDNIPDDQTETSFIEESRKKILENAKVVEDPSQFAYPPSDTRFFQNADIDNGDQKPKSKLEKLTDNNIRVSQRSGESFTEQTSPIEKGKKTTDQVDVVAVQPQAVTNESAGVYIIAVVAGISAAATVGLIAVGIGWYNLQKHVKNASDVEYPAYGVTGPNKDASPSGDRRLAQSAQMYHYQHQKQQIIAMESRAAAGERHGSVSEADSDEENEEGDYTVYECPGLAPTGEMEVKNPLFQDDPTPAQTPPVKPNGDEKK